MPSLPRPIPILRRSVGSVLALGLVAGTLPPAGAVPVEEGYWDFEYGGTVLSSPTAEKPESKVWWNDGYWWASMWNPPRARYEIYRHNVGNHVWTTTQTAIDDRPLSLADALWDGSRLYVVSHVYDKDAAPADTVLDAARLYRYSYSPASDTYTLDPGFPVLVNDSVSETLVLEKDSTGRLWVTWTEDGDVMVNRSTANDRIWGVPFRLPVQDGSARSDDISSIVAFGGDRVGILWSDQKDDRFYFAVHEDGAADLDWLGPETALVDPGDESIADDHLNLATCDATGYVFAAVKTGMPEPEDPEIVLIKRAPDGTWSDATWSTDLDDHTRPILVVSCETNTAYIFATATLTGNQEAIFVKATNLDTMEFPPGLGTPFIESEEDEDLNNPTSTKQAATAESGILVLASDNDTESYLHNHIDLGAGAPPVFFSALPAMGIVGDDVTIMGAGLAGATSVNFDGDPAAFTIVSTAEIRATVPAGAQTGKIRVTTPVASVTSPGDFVVVRPPAIASFAPELGAAGDEVTLTGQYFTGVGSVTFGGVECEAYAVMSDGEIRATVPAAAPSGPITVSNAAGAESTPADFVMVLPPTITYFTPTSGQHGAVVALLGAGFTGLTAVDFGGTPAAGFAVIADTVVTAEVAPGTTTGPVTVENAAGAATSASDFVFTLVTGVDATERPGTFELLPNRPNPFRPSTEILFRTPHEARVTLRVYDVVGRRVVTLVDGVRPAGQHAVRWDGRDGERRRVASGVYVTELRAGGLVARRTLTLRR